VGRFALISPPTWPAAALSCPRGTAIRATMQCTPPALQCMGLLSSPWIPYLHRASLASTLKG
jgi:hypothetical protein